VYSKPDPALTRHLRRGNGQFQFERWGLFTKQLTSLFF
jgi:hypothetical protein